MAKKENSRMVELQVSAALDELGAGDKRPDAAAYAYSAGGKLLDTKPLDAKGNAALKLPLSAQATSVRVLVGPRLPKDTALDEVLRRGAQESHLRVDARTARASLDFTILRDDWLCWLRSACTVRGTLLKRVVSGGVNLDLPVCHARVEIYEVDPLWIILPKLPDDILQKIRDIIIDPRRIPEPIPGPDPAPFAIRTAPVSEHAMDDATAGALKEATASSELRFLAQTGSRLQFEQALVRNAVIVRPLLCFFYPRFVTMQKVGETFTDDCGHFRTLFFNGCHNADTPDLYFKAYQRIFGFFEVPIYAPTPIACHTWWDYVCGTEVTLHTTSRLRRSPARRARRSSDRRTGCCSPRSAIIPCTASSAAAQPARRSANWGLTETGAPWGGILRPRLDFDNSLRETLGVLYYEISWRRGTSGAFTPLNAEVYRHYAHMVGSDLVIDPYRLGPNPVVIGTETHQLYEIPPAVPPVGQWTVANAVTDTENGEFNSVLASRGLSFNVDGTPRQWHRRRSGPLPAQDRAVRRLSQPGRSGRQQHPLRRTEHFRPVRHDPYGGSELGGTARWRYADRRQRADPHAAHRQQPHVGRPRRADHAGRRSGCLLRRRALRTDRLGGYAVHRVPSARLRHACAADLPQCDANPADHHRRRGQLHHHRKRVRHDDLGPASRMHGQAGVHAGSVR